MIRDGKTLGLDCYAYLREVDKDRDKIVNDVDSNIT